MNITLSIYTYADAPGVHVATCPSLNLTGVGHTEAEALADFSAVLDDYVEWTTEHGTLLADLRRLGWHVTQEHAQEPTAARLLRSRETSLQDVLAMPEYRKHSENRTFVLA